MPTRTQPPNTHRAPRGCLGPFFHCYSGTYLHASLLWITVVKSTWKDKSLKQEPIQRGRHLPLLEALIPASCRRRLNGPVSPGASQPTYQKCGIRSRKTHLRRHSGQWSTVYYASGSKGNQFPTRTLMFLRGLVFYPTHTPAR